MIKYSICALNQLMRSILASKLFVALKHSYKRCKGKLIKKCRSVIGISIKLLRLLIAEIITFVISKGYFICFLKNLI